MRILASGHSEEKTSSLTSTRHSERVDSDRRTARYRGSSRDRVDNAASARFEVLCWQSRHEGEHGGGEDELVERVAEHLKGKQGMLAILLSTTWFYTTKLDEPRRLIGGREDGKVVEPLIYAKTMLWRISGRQPS